MVLKTGVEAAADRVVLRNTDLRLDVSRLTGGAAIALRERPGLGLALSVDKVNLDAYLPPPGAAAAPPASSGQVGAGPAPGRSEEPTSELQSLMRTSHDVFCLKKKNTPK